MIQNFKLIIEYDGSAYHGWQRQKKERSVQGEIEHALKVMTGREVSVIGSGRTDAGVHALGQVGNFTCDTRLTADVFLTGLNGILPEDIVIRACQEVAQDFHSRYGAFSKTYQYRIFNGPIPIAICRQYAWHIRRPLDLAAMRRGLDHITGTRDFKSFEGAGSPRADTIRTVIRADLFEKKNSIIVFEITANGFLRFMVRNIVGSLADVGIGKLKPDDLERIIQAKDRKQAGATAPPHGLFLMGVEYAGDRQ